MAQSMGISRNNAAASQDTVILNLAHLNETT